MKNIIAFHLDDSRNLRGGERQAVYLTNELNKLGIVSYIISRKNSPLHKKSIEMNLPVITLPYLWEWDIISALILAFKIKKINSQNKKVIIHTHTGHTPAIAILSRLFIKAKIVAHRRVDFKIKNNFLSKIKYKKADIIIAISNAIKKILINSSIPTEKIKVIYSSIDKNLLLQLANKSQRNEKKIIGSLIALEPHKDPQNLIKAAQISLKYNPNLLFLIGGEGSLKKDIENMIYRLNLVDNVKLLGYLNDNIKFLKSIDIFVLPSKKEGLGSVLIEAMASALPLVGTDAGGIPELIKNDFNGFIVPKENPQQLSNAIIKILSDPQIYEKFSKNSLESVKELTSDIMAKQTLEIYEKISKNS